MLMSPDQIRNRFSYHPPSPAGVGRHQALTDGFIQLATLVEVTCPDSMEKASAFAKLEEAKFAASAAVARNPETR